MNKEVKSHLILVLLLAIWMSLQAQNQVTVEHMSGVTIPYPYDLAVGKPDSLLHFYQSHANSDSIWIDTFTCDLMGNFSELSNLHTYNYNSTAVDTPDVCLFEYRYNKVYLHVLVDSTLIVCTIDDNNNAMDHLIDIQGIPLGEYLWFYGTPYCLFDEYNIIATTYYGEQIYRIDLHNDSITSLVSQPYACQYQLYPLKDDYLLAISRSNSSSTTLYIDRDFGIHYLTGDNEYEYFILGKVAISYYPIVANSMAFYSLFGYLTIFENSLNINVFDYDSLDNVLEYDESIEPLPGNFYTCITVLSDSNGGGPFIKWFKTYEVSNGNRILYTGFPNLSDYADPRLIQRINDDYIVALSGAIGSPVEFILIDNARQQLTTSTFTIDDNSDGWDIYPAGLSFYLVKNDRVHSFRLNVPQGTDDNVDIPGLTDLSCNPNPFTGKTSIAIKFNKSTPVTVTVYDTKGRKVVELVKDYRLSTKQIIEWKGDDAYGHRLPSGIYFIRVEAEGKSLTQKILFFK